MLGDYAGEFKGIGRFGTGINLNPLHQEIKIGNWHGDKLHGWALKVNNANVIYGMFIFHLWYLAFLWYLAKRRPSPTPSPGPVGGF